VENGSVTVTPGVEETSSAAMIVALVLPIFSTVTARALQSLYEMYPSPNTSYSTKISSGKTTSDATVAVTLVVVEPGEVVVAKAVLVNVPVVSGVTSMLMICVSPGARSPSEQATIPAVSEQPVEEPT